MIRSQNDYATISAVSMDGKQLSESGEVLVQVGTTARLTGWEEKDAEFEFQKQTIRGKQIVNTGAPPWRIANTLAQIAITNPDLKTATLLDVGGYALREIPLNRSGRTASVELPANSMYMVLQ